MSKNRYEKRGALARSRLRLTDDVLPLERLRQHARLNRRAILKILVRDGMHDLFREIQIMKARFPGFRCNDEPRNIPRVINWLRRLALNISLLDGLWMTVVWTLFLSTDFGPVVPAISPGIAMRGVLRGTRWALRMTMLRWFSLTQVGVLMLPFSLL